MKRNAQLALLESAIGMTMEGGQPYQDFLPKGFASSDRLAMDANADIKAIVDARGGLIVSDAQPGLVTVPNSAIPSILTTFVDPKMVEILLAKNQATNIMREEKKGTFIDTNVIFPVTEYTGEVSSYGDFNNNGRAGANLNFPERQPYNYQVIVEYGQVEMEKAGLAKIGWAAALQRAAVIVLNKFQNFSYFYGVAGLQNYGLLNDPLLNPPMAPAPKANGGNSWWVNNAPNATANEVYNDIDSLFVLLIEQSQGLVDRETPMTLSMSPKSEGALTFTNSFNVNVSDLMKKNFPNMKVKTAVQYGAQTASNPQGNPAGEFMQLMADSVEGQETGFMAFNEKLRGGPVILGLSSFSQKLAQGSWGCVIQQPFAISSMVGI